MVVPGGKVQHLPGPCGRHGFARIGGDAGAAGKDAEIERFQVRETIVGAFDGHHRLVRFDGVAVVERPDPERRPVVAAQFEQRNGFIDAAQ